MGTLDPRVDGYIEAAQPFARPILRHLRELVHRHCPDVVETIKWGMPHFERQGALCHMAAFKHHCAFGFRRGDEVTGRPATEGAMGQFGRIGALTDLPADAELGAWIRAAAQLNTAGGKTRKPAPSARAHLDVVPEDLAAALAANPAAAAAFARFPPSHRREYIEWLVDSRRPETRQRRLVQALAWIAEGKSRNWKYQRRA